MKYKDLREQNINCFEYLDQLIRKGYITVLEAMAGENLWPHLITCLWK